jgi:hypothetical protein
LAKKPFLAETKGFPRMCKFFFQGLASIAFSAKKNILLCKSPKMGTTIKKEREL